MKLIKALGWALIWALAVFIVSCQLIQDLFDAKLVETNKTKETNEQNNKEEAR